MNSEAVTGADARAGSVMVGIPAYNEQETVAAVIDESRRYADAVLVVDDGSDDRTAERAVEAGADVIEHGQNRGYGGALQTIFDCAYRREVSHLVVIDADGQHDPNDVAKLVEAQRSSGAQIVIGSRFTNGAKTDARLYRRFGLAVINQLTNVGLRFAHAVPRVTDTQSGLRVYDREAVEAMCTGPPLSDGMDASIDILFRAAERDYEFAEVPVNITYDVEDASTHHPLTQGLVLVFNILRRLYHERPSRLLGIPGALFILIGGGLAAGILSNVSLVQTVPLLVVGLLLSIGGVLSGAAVVSGNKLKK